MNARGQEITKLRERDRREMKSQITKQQKAVTDDLVKITKVAQPLQTLNILRRVKKGRKEVNKINELRCRFKLFGQ